MREKQILSEDVLKQLLALLEQQQEKDEKIILAMLRQLVPEFKMPRQVY